MPRVDRQSRGCYALVLARTARNANAHPHMSKRHKARARSVRHQLFDLLGKRCKHCGTDKDLTFDCITPQGHKHHAHDTDRRMRFYCAQFLDGNLQVLCGSCNARKSDDHQEHKVWLKIPYTIRLRVLARFVPAATYRLTDPF